MTAALARSILPSVIARGATGIRVIAAGDDGVITLEADGSPGAVLPTGLPDRGADPRRRARCHRGQAGGADPGPPTGGRGSPRARPSGSWTPRSNPSIAAHRGHVTVASADGGWVRVRLEGGCQGCSLAEVTIRQGIEPLLRARLPGVTGVADVTDHEAGTDPFFSPEKR